MTKFICETKNLSKKYKDFYALKNVNLTMHSAESSGLRCVSERTLCKAQRTP